MGHLDHFFWTDADTSLLIQGEYHPGLVTLSIIIAIIICCISMQIAGIARSSHSGLFRHLAVITGSVALALGIWSMHFIGMLAFRLNLAVTYDLWMTALSILPALLAAWVTLDILARRRITQGYLLLGGVLIGGGIGAMHYIGMEAMQMDARLYYDVSWFIASILISVVLSWSALWIRFGLLQQRLKIGNTAIILLSGGTLGLAVTSMHYVAMEAARFVGQEMHHDHRNLELILTITLVTLILGFAVLFSNLFLRFRALYHQLQLSEASQKAIFETAIDGIITIDAQGKILSVNPSATQLLGWQAEELIGQNVSLLMPEPDRSHHDQYLATYLKGRKTRVIGDSRETTAQRKDGSNFPIRLAVGEVRTDDTLMFVGFITDISAQKRIEQQLEREATRDPLTDLYNRRFLSIALPRAMARTNRNQSMLALLFIDLDGFKQVNDTLGHEIGDELLKLVAQRLLHLVRSVDLVVRLAGDEFVILLEGLKTEDDAWQMANRILDAITRPMPLKEYEVNVGASIGMSFYCAGDILTDEELLKQADDAMYRVKKNGKGQVALL